MTARESLAHALRLRFGIAPTEPTDDQLDKIEAAISRIPRPTEHDWERAVRTYCPTAGTYKYGALDNSDLNALLAQAAQGPKQKTVPKGPTK